MERTEVTEEERQAERTLQRYAANGECWLKAGEDAAHGTTVDLGLGGLFLHTEEPMDVGTDVQVELVLPELSAIIQATGTVAWVIRAGGNAKPGIGVKFGTIGAGAAELATFLHSDNVTPWPGR